jgi:hypothetical protein
MVARAPECSQHALGAPQRSSFNPLVQGSSPWRPTSATPLTPPLNRDLIFLSRTSRCSRLQVGPLPCPQRPADSLSGVGHYPASRAKRPVLATVMPSVTRAALVSAVHQFGQLRVRTVSVLLPWLPAISIRDSESWMPLLLPLVRVSYRHVLAFCPRSTAVQGLARARAPALRRVRAGLAASPSRDSTGQR